MDKSEVRALVRERRRARSPAEREEAAVALAARARDLLPAECAEVACYSSLPAEPGTAVLLDRLAADGHGTWLPRIAGTRLDWVRIGPGTAFRPGPMGIVEPVGPGQADLPAVDVVLLPGLAADRDGWRLGQGGGFYDRVLAGVPRHADAGPLRVLLLFDDEVLDAVPHEPHDCRVDVIVTPSRTLAVPATA